MPGKTLLNDLFIVSDELKRIDIACNEAVTASNYPALNDTALRYMRELNKEIAKLRQFNPDREEVFPIALISYKTELLFHIERYALFLTVAIENISDIAVIDDFKFFPVEFFNALELNLKNSRIQDCVISAERMVGLLNKNPRRKAEQEKFTNRKIAITTVAQQYSELFSSTGFAIARVVGVGVGVAMVVPVVGAPIAGAVFASAVAVEVFQKMLFSTSAETTEVKNAPFIDVTDEQKAVLISQKIEDTDTFFELLMRSEIARFNATKSLDVPKKLQKTTEQLGLCLKAMTNRNNTLKIEIQEKLLDLKAQTGKTRAAVKSFSQLASHMKSWSSTFIRAPKECYLKNIDEMEREEQKSSSGFFGFSPSKKSLKRSVMISGASQLPCEFSTTVTVSEANDHINTLLSLCDEQRVSHQKLLSRRSDPRFKQCEDRRKRLEERLDAVESEWGTRIQAWKLWQKNMIRHLDIPDIYESEELERHVPFIMEVHYER